MGYGRTLGTILLRIAGRPAFAAAILTVGLPTPMVGQPLEGTGIVATGLLLRRLDGVKRVLMIGAHPDDEDTSLLAELSRGMGAETAYLSLTRGEGGQNLIGPELWDGLGIIRTGELEAARRLDGGRQYFTRAFDFGFSKRVDEALTFWPREELLSDVVWVIRTFRPQVVVAVFSGTPRDGHGHHQAAGIMTREAFEAAGDPARFPEQLGWGVEPWKPSKLYGGVWRRPSEASVPLRLGAYDPLLGRSLLQLAMEARSFHRSQDMGAAQPLGPRASGLRLERGGGGREGDDGVFAGVDTTLAGAAASLPEPAASRTREHLEAYRAAVARARLAFGGADPYAVVAPLTDALDRLHRAETTAGSAADRELHAVLAEKSSLARSALLAAAGVVLDVRAADDLVTPGQTVRVTAHAWNGGPVALRDATAALRVPDGWRAALVSAEGVGPDGSLAPGAVASWVFDVTLPADAALSKLYYLRRPRDGAWYRWPDEPALRGLPRDPARVRGVFAFDVPSDQEVVPVRQEVPWRYVGVNPARGEYRRPVLVVPPVSVSVSPAGMAWPGARSEPRALTVTLRTDSPDGNRGVVRLIAPEGWTASSDEMSFELAGEGATRSFTFEVKPAAGFEEGEHVFRAEAMASDGTRYSEGFSIVDYEHIERAALFAPAEARIAVLDVRVADELRVGYIMGTGDDGPEAVRQVDAEVTLLDADAVRSGDFSAFDVVVVGVRAYETRADLRAANARLLDYARGGGTVIVQYNQYDFPRGGYAPYAVSMGRPAARVAEEDAEVTVLHPDAPVFTTPNRIGPGDFEGWVQERGLYFLSEWDDAFTPLIEMHDVGEEPSRGALLVAPVGDGVYVYAALSFFRQWSALVPGAYRLWANLLSLDAVAWRRFGTTGERGARAASDG